jgi:hypothetical protein
MVGLICDAVGNLRLGPLSQSLVAAATAVVLWLVVIPSFLLQARFLQMPVLVAVCALGIVAGDRAVADCMSGHTTAITFCVVGLFHRHVMGTRGDMLLVSLTK